MVKGVDVADVFLWGEQVGAVAWDRINDLSVFEFEKNFVRRELDVSPLMMPLENLQRGELTYSFRNLSKETYHGLPGMLADLLPDRFGNRIIDAWLAKNGRNPQEFSPVERLCYTGARGMGALEFRPSYKSFDQSVAIDVASIVELANEVMDNRSSLNTNLLSSEKDAILDIMRVGTSAGGARPKAVVALNDATGEIRSGQVSAPSGFDYWLLKFDGVSDDSLQNTKGYGRIEYAYFKMAKDAGIIMSESRLLEEKGRAHFMTKRFDRIGGKKVHMQTLCGIAHFDFNISGGYSYEQAFQIMRRLRLPYTDIEQMYVRMIFNVVARNQDDHTKNISFLMDESGKWSLSPAYDMTYSYNPDGSWTNRHQMSINGKRDAITKEDLIAVGKKMDIKHPEKLIDKVSNTVERWSDFAKDSGVTTSQIKSIGKVILFDIR